MNAPSWVERIRTIPDYPVKGVLFRDLTPLWKDPSAFAEAQAQLCERVRGYDFDLVAAVEARGFIFAAPLALEYGKGFVPLRKPGKLPADTVEVEYELEYGIGRLQIHRDAVAPGQRVLVVDDLLATGGTSLACARLIEQLGGEVAAFAYVVELGSLGGRERLRGYPVESLVVL